MTGVRELAERNAPRGDRDIRVVAHDAGVLTAQLERDGAQVLGSGLINLAPRVWTTGKKHVREAQRRERRGYLCVAASESLLRLTTLFQFQEIGGAFIYVKN